MFCSVGSVLDSGRCFVVCEVFWILGSVFGLGLVFWILRSVLSLWATIPSRFMLLKPEIQRVQA